MELLIGDCTLHYEIVGDGDPILFVHGFPLSGEMWTEVARKLGGGWRSIIPDLRGHGRSSATVAASMTQYADDLAALLDKLREWRPVVLVGLSMGGYVAFEIFRRHRARVRGLVLADTRADTDTAEGRAKRQEMINSVEQRGAVAAADVMTDKLFGPHAGSDLRAHWQGIMSRTPPAGITAALKAMADRSDSMPLLAQINCPTLIVVGEHDVITPVAVSSEMHAAIRGSRLEIIAGAGHMPPVEQPEAFSNVLSDFLNGLA